MLTIQKKQAKYFAFRREKALVESGLEKAVEQAELRRFEALCGEVSDYITHLTQLIHAAGIIRELNCPEHQRRDDHI